ncbi:hypothetical protein ACFY0G_32470 [Streptomyces sp. NPDC001552]|uniref:hypothetical protein n=1 Tax=Streptomyces sp. NPDC001552 TaxID=3364587 RepID=UPI0036CC9FEF
MNLTAAPAAPFVFTAEEIAFVAPWMSAQTAAPVALPAAAPFELSADDMSTLIPFMRDQLTAQGKGDDDVELCMTFSAIFRRASTAYGTAPFAREQCICNG